MAGKCGAIVDEIIILQKIRSISTILWIEDVFDFMTYDSDNLNDLKQNVGFGVKSDQYRIKLDILKDANSHLEVP